MALMTFSWFLERLDVARWESEQAGARSAFVNCPVHGGSDSLHITEKNGKALIKCFGCEADAVAVQEALEAEPQDIVPKPRGRRVSPFSTGHHAAADGDEGSTPSASITPLDWLAERCSITRAELDALNLPLAEHDNLVGFDFPESGATKWRKADNSKTFSWAGPAAPSLWPMPTKPQDEIVVCEGEADVICLRHSGFDAYSVTKGTQGAVPASIWEALAAEGVETVVLLFDMDDAGRKGRAAAAEGARAAGLMVLEGRVAGIRPLAGEKDARDVARRQGYPLGIEHDANEDYPVLLSDIELVMPEPPLFDRVHASEHSILYGDGSSGKGVVAANWVSRMTIANMRVLIVDYEYHASSEWKYRIDGFGGDMTKVAIIQPQKPIWEIAGWLRDIAAGFDYVVVDSVTYACFGEEVEKSVNATRYSMAINMIGKPTLSIAHVTKENLDPNHPFGSIFWSNGARVTIGLSRKKADDPESERIMRNPKSNQRAGFRTLAIDWSWLPNDAPPGCACANPPQDQVMLKRHLHETEVNPTLRVLVKEATDAIGYSLPDVVTYFEDNFPNHGFSKSSIAKWLVDLRPPEFKRSSRNRES